jgi:hypothetical protein
MLDKMVALATLVKPRAAFIVQFARNQRKQNTDARYAVSRVVRGARAAEVDVGGIEDERWGGLFAANYCEDEGRGMGCLIPCWVASRRLHSQVVRFHLKY